MTTVRDALNELKWREDALDDHVAITYVHRGAPGDVRTVHGDAVHDLGRSFMEIASRHGTTMIPYHRVLVVERDGREVWRRDVQAQDSAWRRDAS